MSTQSAPEPSSKRPTRSTRTLVIGAVLVILGAAAGGAAGVVRTPTYTSSLDLAVGTNGLGGSTAPGYVQAIETLAGNYSRGITRPAVVDPVSRQLGLSTDAVAARLAATPVPDSSVIRLTASGEDGPSTVRLANAAARVFADVTTSDTAQATGRLPLQDVQDAELAVLRAQRTLRRARQDAVSENSTTVLRAQARLSAQQTRARTVRSQYAQTRQALVPVGVTVIRPAKIAASDRRSTFLLFVILGALIGFVGALGLRALANRPVA